MGSLLDILSSIIAGLGDLLVRSLDLVKIIARHPMGKLLILICVFIALLDVIILIFERWSKES